MTLNTTPFQLVKIGAKEFWNRLLEHLLANKHEQFWQWSLDKQNAGGGGGRGGGSQYTVHAIRNKTFANSREFVWTFSKFIKNYEFRTNFVYKVHMRIRIRICENKRKDSCPNLILKEESNLCTNLNKPTRLHQDRNSKTSYFDNFMVSFWKVNYQDYIEVLNLQLFVRNIHHQSVSYVCLCICSFLCDPSMIW